jgi:hypothetical protein
MRAWRLLELAAAGTVRVPRADPGGPMTNDLPPLPPLPSLPPLGEQPVTAMPQGVTHQPGEKRVSPVVPSVAPSPPADGSANSVPPTAEPAAPGTPSFPSGRSSGQSMPNVVPWVAWVIAALTCGYMLPWAVAVQRRVQVNYVILLVDLLTGWTTVGWVVALVMALTMRTPEQAATTVPLSGSLFEKAMTWVRAHPIGTAAIALTSLYMVIVVL